MRLTPLLTGVLCPLRLLWQLASNVCQGSRHRSANIQVRVVRFRRLFTAVIIVLAGQSAAPAQSDRTFVRGMAHVHMRLISCLSRRSSWQDGAGRHLVPQRLLFHGLSGIYSLIGRTRNALYDGGTCNLFVPVVMIGLPQCSMYIDMHLCIWTCVWACVYGHTYVWTCV